MKKNSIIRNQASLFAGITLTARKVKPTRAVKKLLTMTRKRQLALQESIPTGRKLRKLFEQRVCKKAA